MPRAPELPLFRRELVALLRTRKAAWCVRLVVILSGAIPLFFWPTGAELPRILGAESVWTFCAFFLAQLTTALLLVPAFTAGAIAGERESDTYDALYTTLLRPSSIVLSKAAAAAGFILLVLTIASPAAFVLYFLGGLTLAAILKCYAVLAASLTASAIVCLYHSMSSRRTAHAAVRGYFWVFFWNVGLMALSALCFGMLGSVLGPAMSSSEAIYYLYAAMLSSPYMAIPWQLFGGAGFSPPLGLEAWSWQIVFAGAVAAAHFALVLLRARTPEPPRPLWLERRALRRQASARPIPRPFLVAWLARDSKRHSGPSSNPIFRKELLSEFFGRRRYRHAAFWLPLLLFGAIASTLVSNGEWVVHITMAVNAAALALVLLVVPAVAASSFPRELEQGNLDFLRGTRLSWGEIHRGKLWAAVVSGAGITAAATWVTGASAVMGGFADALGWLERGYNARARQPWGLSVLVHMSVPWITLVSTAVLATAVSAFCRRTLGALIATYGLLAAWLIGVPILLISGGGPGRDVESALGALHPFGAMSMAMEHRDGGFACAIAYLLIAAVFSFLACCITVGRLDSAYAVDP